MDNPTDLAIFAALAAGAFAAINGLVSLVTVAVKALIKKRNGDSAPNPAPSAAAANGPAFSSADRLLLEQTHKGVEESFSQRRRISDAIKDGFHEMSNTLAESISEDKRQTDTLDKLVQALEDENWARRAR